MALPRHRRERSTSRPGITRRGGARRIESRGGRCRRHVMGLTLLHEAGSFSIAFYSGFVVERRYGLSNERFAGWLRDQAKSLGLGLMLGCRRRERGLFLHPPARQADGGCRPARCSRCSSSAWRIVAPVVLLPLFYRVKPLDRDALRAPAAGTRRAGGRARARRVRMGPRRQDQEGERRARGARRDAADSGVRYDARRLFRRRNRGRPGARARAPRPRRHLEGDCASKAR